MSADAPTALEQISTLTAGALAAFIVATGVTILVLIWRGTIKLDYLLSETPTTAADGTPQEPKASLSRFQALIFTFVIAGLYLIISLKNGILATIDEGPMVLLGITTAGYLGGKAISDQKKP